MEFTIIFIWILVGLWAAYIAKNRNRSQVGWAIAGMIFGLFAVLLVALLPSIENGKVTKKRIIKK